MSQEWTWHQKRRFRSFKRLEWLFLNTTTRRYEPRTWRELAQGMPKATLSSLLHECIAKGIVKTELQARVEGRWTTVYTLKKTAFKTIHKKPDTGGFEIAAIPFSGKDPRTYRERVRAGKGKGTIYERRTKRTETRTQTTDASNE